MDNTLLIAILTPVLLTTGGIVSWLIKAKREESINSELKSREFKIDTYKKLLDPFIASLTFTLSTKIKEKEVNKIQSLEYRKTVFDLTTFGSDEAIKIFNTMMQTFFHKEKYQGEDYGIRVLALLSEFLLQVRKDIYSSKSNLKRSDMIEFMLTDIEEYKSQINNYAFIDAKR